MSSSQIYINKTPFLGRVEEQKQFRAVLRELLALQSDEGLPYVLLLYGDSGMSRTSLARVFDRIVKEEEPFAGSFQTLWIDWEEERNRSVGLQVGRDNIAPETVLDLLHAAAARIDLGRHFDGYQKARKLRAEAEKKAAEALNPTGERDDWSEFRSLSASALAKVLRQFQPVVGETGEKLTKAALDAGLKYSAEKVAAVETRLRARLNPELFHAFLHPTEQLARALAEGLKHATESGYVFAGKPLVITLDTYEIVDRADLWLRMVMKSAGPRVLWIVCGRDDLSRSRQFGADYFKGYTADWPHRLWNWDMRQLAHDDDGKYFKLTVPERPLDEQQHETISRATRGIPLALSEAAELWQRGATLDQIASDIDDTTPASGIVRAMTARYLLHAMKHDVDRRALYALSLARGNRELLRALLRPEGDGGFDLNARLQQLERDYASVHFAEARLHDEPAVFFREDLKRMRDEDWVRQINQRAIVHLRARLQKLESDLPRIEDRCGDEDWGELALRMTDHLFFVDEDEAWRWFVPRFVESLAYSDELREGLAGIADSWRKALSSRGAKRVKLFRQASSDQADADKFPALLDEIDALAKRGWLNGEGENERLAIVAWQRGLALHGASKFIDALAMCERAFHLLPPECETFRESLAEAFSECGWELGVVRGTAIPSPDAEAALRRATELRPNEGVYCVKLGVMQVGQKKFAEAAASIQKGISLGGNEAWALNGLGNVYGDLGRREDAIAAYQQAIALDPKDAAPHNGLGNVYSDLGRHEDAIAAYQQAIALDPKFALPHYELGAVYRDLGRREDAIAAYQQAIALDPKDASPHYGLGAVYRDLGRHEDAIAAFQQAIALDPEDARTHNGLGNVYGDLGRHEDAIAAYQQAIALDPIDAAPHNGLGNVYGDLGRHEDAIAAYQQAIALDPKDALPHNNLGLVYRDLGRHEDAIAAYQQAIALDPKFATPHNNLGLVYRDLGRHEDATAAYQQAIAIDPKSVYPHDNLGDLYCDLNRKEDAIAAYQQAIALDPKFVYPHNGLGLVYRDLGRHEDAIAAFQQAIALDPKDALPHNGLGNVYGDLGRREDAIAAYQQAIALDPIGAAPHNGLGNVYGDLGRHEDAIAAYQQAIALDPKFATPHNNLGLVYRDLGRHEDAIAAFQQAIALDPKDALPHNGLGAVYSDLGRHEDAIAAYHQAIALDPKDAFPHYGLGNVYSDLGRHEDAIAAFQQAIAIDPIDAVPHYGLGNVYSDLGRHEDAIAAYQQAIALDPKFAHPHYGLGNILRILGRYEEAVAAYQQAADLDPKDAEASFALAACYRKLGQTEAFEMQINLARDLIGEAKDYDRACFEAIRGNTDEALRLLKMALEKKAVNLAWARRDPDFDWIRDDPRFAALLDEMTTEA